MAKITRLKLTAENAEELQALVSLDTDVLAKVGYSLGGQSAALLRVRDLERKLRAEGVDGSSSVFLARNVAALKRVALRYDVSSSEVLDALQSSINRSAYAELKDKWPRLRPNLQRLMDLAQVEQLVKAVDLYNDHGATLSGARVLTDVRPVFNKERSGLVGVIVFNTLKVDYADTEKAQALEVVIDLEDMGRLIDELERARKKTRVLCELVENKLGLTHAIVSEGDRVDSEGDSGAGS